MTGQARQEFADMPMRMLVLAPNVREKPGNLDQLADSILQVGVLEPIVCCPHPTEKERFEVLMGQRRFLAAKQAGMKRIPALVRSKPSEHERVLLQIAENFERDDMSPVDEGRAFAQLLKGAMTQTALQKTVHRSAGFIRERLDVIELPSVVQGAIHVEMVSVKCALAIPPVLFARLDDRKTLNAFKRALVDGDEAVRDWVSYQVHGYAERGAAVPKMMQQFNCQMNQEIIRRVKRAAAQEGVLMNEWVEQALADAADRVLDGVPA